MNGCPDRERLERFLAHRLDDTALDEIDQHVEACAICQLTLEELTSAAVFDVDGRGSLITLVAAGAAASVDQVGTAPGATTGHDVPLDRARPSVAGYEIQGELGRGGMGVVYEARHIRLNRPCALKMILAGAHAGPEDVARFVTEAEAIARLQHPNIVQIHNIGDAGGLPFLELELVAGGSLDNQLDGTPWPPARAAHLCEQVVRGITEAHRQGIVHRDLKPSNVLLAADGTPKVGDFGLAKMMDNHTSLTRTESVMGSPSYMAPEQAWGRARVAGPAVDVYALGAILYELLTGRPPFRGTTATVTLEQVKTTDPVAPSRLVPAVPADIETICLKCLQKDPGKRYEGAQALGDDLRRFLAGRTILARRAGALERAWRWCKRNRFVAATTGVAAAAIIILAVGATVAAFTFREQRDQIRLADRKANENLIEALTAQARATRFSRQVGQRFESLDALKRAARIARELGLPPERFDRIRDQAIACFALPDIQATGRVIEVPPLTGYGSFDPGMNRYAVRLQSGAILVRRFADDDEIARFQAQGDREVYVFAFSADGRYLMTNHYPGFALTVWEVDRNVVALEDPGPVSRSAARFSPDSRTIALAHRDGEVVTYDLETRRRGRFLSGLGSIRDVAFRADGRQLAVTGSDPKGPACAILDAKSGHPVRTIALRSQSSVAWSTDGATLATTGDDYKIDLWDAHAGLLKARLEGSSNNGLRAAFHPAGTVLASTGFDGRLRLWDAALGSPVLSLTGNNPARIGALAVGRDGQVVLESEGRLTTYQIDPALECRAFAHVFGDRSTLQRPSMRRDNRLMAVGSDNGVILWDLARGTECAILPIGNVGLVMFEANGDLLTSGTTGMQRWPVELNAQQGKFQVGPPRDLSFSKKSGHIDEDRPGRIIATARRTHVELEISGRLTRIGPIDECRYVAVSPDGEWVATGSHHFGAVTVHVWRVRDCTKVVELPVNMGRWISFSPNGKWLLTGSPPSKVWSTGDWALARELGGAGLCFSPDSRLVVVLDASQTIRLVEAESGRPVARLERPGPSAVSWATVSPDGSRLVVVPETSSVLYVWDLRAVRKRLAEMGLDWDAPAYPDDDPAAVSLPPLPPLQVDLGPQSQPRASSNPPS